MIEKIKAYKTTDGKLFEMEHEAYNHDASNAIKDLLDGSNISITERYSFAKNKVIPYAEDWLEVLLPLVEYRKRKTEAEAKKIEVASVWPGAEVRVVGGTVVDDEVPF